MQIKLLHIRGNGLHLPVMAMRPEENEREESVLDRAGYGRNAVTQERYVLLFHLQPRANNWLKGTFAPHAWGTGEALMKRAHVYLREHWCAIESGDSLTFRSM